MTNNEFSSTTLAISKDHFGMLFNSDWICDLLVTDFSTVDDFQPGRLHLSAGTGNVL
jgi:hypothetical protein